MIRTASHAPAPIRDRARSRRGLVWCETALAVLLVAGCATSSHGQRSADGAGSTTTGRAARTTGKPNVLFVLTDDMRLDDLQFMPKVRELIADQGVSFDSYFDNVTLCCPARTSILRGQYSHNTGVLTNGGGNGGFETAHADMVERSTIATAMRDAGYTTGLFGKYLNGYPHTAGPDFVPPGWDRWSSSSKGYAYGEYDYTLNEDGKQVAYGHGPDDYGTDVYTRQTREFITRAVTTSTPFFAYLSVYAPHEPSTPAPQDAEAFPGLQAPRDPAYDEADVSDKPRYIRALGPLSPQRQQKIDQRYRKRAQSLQAVDRGVASLVEELQANHQLDNTYIIFTSDNGFHLGQHRMPSGKQTAYETDIHLPLLVRGPGVTKGSHVTALTGNVDLAPTIAEIGGGRMTDDPDGRSLVPLFTPTNDRARTRWRQVFLVEHWTETSTSQDRSGAGQLEPDDLDQTDVTPSSDAPRTPRSAASPRRSAAAASRIPEFQGLRLPTYTYVEYSTGERELYDLTRDPNELNNLAGTATSTLLDALHRRLDGMRSCAGDTCRDRESAPLAVPR
jgi:N-acetylglucosamine-6-sulfatase